MDFVQCSHILKNGNRCKRSTRMEGGLCWQHDPEYRQNSQQQQCASVQPAVQIPAVRSAQVQIPAVRSAQVPIRPVWPAQRAVLLTPIPPEQRLGFLANLAANSQNVHNSQVVRQYQPLVKRILDARSLYQSQQTMARVKDAFRQVKNIPTPVKPAVIRLPWWRRFFCIGLKQQTNQPTNPAQIAMKNAMIRIIAHMQDLYTYSTNSVPSFPNITFANLLDGAVKLIDSQSPDIATTLWNRLYEEMEDGRGYCLHGNMVRLLNTFSGILDEAVVVNTKVSTGESLQNRIAAIATNSTLSVEERRAAAEAVLRELTVPQNEWQAWIEAID